MPPCRFCNDPAVARFDVDEGCACFPDDRVQELCPQHIVQANPTCGMELTAVYTLERRFGEWVQAIPGAWSVPAY